MATNEFPYLHGFNTVEQNRLKKQATFTEFSVYQDINLADVKKLLEVGCGVGAQSEILLRRFPNINLTSIDLSDNQLRAAKQTLEALSYAQERYSLHKMNASDMEFDSHHFDGAFLCWILEHVPDPAKVLSEVRRVLKPGSVIYITEVLNSSFFLEPYSPNVWKYWMAFNDYQFDMKGDPFVGAKLGNMLLQQGYRDIEVTTKTWHLDNRRPDKRKEFIDFWTELLLSAADQLIAASYVDQETVDKVKEELKIVRRDPNAVFYYSFIQARAKAF